MAEAAQPSEIARETLRRLAAQRLPPTPDNYRSLYHEIAGTAPAEPFPDRPLKAIVAALPRARAEQLRFARQLESAVADKDWGAVKSALLAREAPENNWSALIRELLSGYERRAAGLTAARKRESLEHILTAGAGDAAQLYARLQALTRAWSQAPAASGEALTDALAAPAQEEAAGALKAGAAPLPVQGEGAEIRELVAGLLENSIHMLLADTPELADEASALAAEVRRAVPGAALKALTARLKKFAFRLQWVAEDQSELKAAMLHLLRLIVENIGELVVDDQWLHGQIAMLGEAFSQPLSLPRLDDAQRRLKELIYKQGTLKKSLEDARERLKAMLAGFGDHLADFAESTDDYQQRIGHCAGRISAARDIAELSDVVEEVMRETRSLQLSAARSRDELRSLKARADEAEGEVARLQNELALTSEMVRQDQLTGALNRKGLDEALERELARAQRRAAPLCVGLLDVDNFKKLNDAHGHQAGDAALMHLAAVVRDALRPQDSLARYGGEEFVVILPDTELEDGVAVMVRLQRELTRRFFLNNNDRILITFSAGVTQATTDDTAPQALARADAGMYEAKRSGKNRVVAVR